VLAAAFPGLGIGLCRSRSGIWSHRPHHGVRYWTHLRLSS
jgi:hypothetical protein